MEAMTGDDLGRWKPARPNLARDRNRQLSGKLKAVRPAHGRQFLRGRPAGLTVMVPSWACSLTTRGAGRAGRRIFGDTQDADIGRFAYKPQTAHWDRASRSRSMLAQASVVVLCILASPVIGMRAPSHQGAGTDQSWVLEELCKTNPAKKRQYAPEPLILPARRQVAR